MEHQGSPRFGGDMDRNEVEIDLNKFMALLQEKSELKDRIRELEDEYNRNPFQKVIFVAEALDSWRIIPRAKKTVNFGIIYRHCWPNYSFDTSFRNERKSKSK